MESPTRRRRRLREGGGRESGVKTEIGKERRETNSE